MKQWILIGFFCLFGDGQFWGVGLSESLAQERRQFTDETRSLVEQYEILKVQSSILVETIKSLKYERENLLEKVEILQSQQRDVVPKVKELSIALQQARKTLGVLRLEHQAALARVEALEKARFEDLNAKMQELNRSLEKANP